MNTSTKDQSNLESIKDSIGKMKATRKDIETILGDSDCDKPDDTIEPNYIDCESVRYVTCIDNFMSGWGPASGKKNVLSFRCKTPAEAQIVADNARNRTDMTYIKISKMTPSRYYSSRYLLQHKDDSVYSSWYIKDYFKD